MAKFDPVTFINEVRAETAKVIWPTRKETTITTIMVFVLVIIAAIFFLIVDWFIRLGVGAILGIGA